MLCYVMLCYDLFCFVLVWFGFLFDDIMNTDRSKNKLYGHQLCDKRTFNLPTHSKLISYHVLTVDKKKLIF